MSGYRQLKTRVRAACWAHVRRKFYPLREKQDARHILDIIGVLYFIESEVKKEKLDGTEQHLEIRQGWSRLALQALFDYLQSRKRAVARKSLMGKAISYALKNEEALRRFTDDTELFLDNNACEHQLRVIALGRKNSLFVEHPNAGKNLAILHSLVSTCELNG